MKPTSVKLYMAVAFLLMTPIFGQEKKQPVRERINLKKTVNPVHSPAIIQKRHINYISITDCHNVIVRDCDIFGGIKLDDSYPEIGIKNILFENCYIHDSTSDRLIFMAGSNVSNITFKNCVLERCIGGTHLAYFSGGHWKSNYPPISNITLKDCVFRFTPGGRNIIQFNGRFSGINITRCLFAHGQMNGLNFIGCQDVMITDCVFYGNNRGCIGIYNYVDGGYWDLKGDAPKKKPMDHWKRTHHGNRRYMIKNNTMVMGPKQFSWDKWHNDNPLDGHPAVFVKNIIPEEYQKGMETKDIYLIDNIIWTPGLDILHCTNEKEAQAVRFVHNMLFSTHKEFSKDNLERLIPNLKDFKVFEANFVQDPCFKEGPPEYDFFKKEEARHSDWTKFKTRFNSFSEPGKKKGVGVREKEESE